MDEVQRGQRTGAPYATGGGGTVLEHLYGALLLSSLLAGDPVTELGDDAVPVSLRFQAAAVSPVDDLVLTGHTSDGMQRSVSISVRRAPALLRSEEASGRLFASYLSVVADRWDDLRSGRRRLCLAVASLNAAASQLRELTEIARETVDKTGFQAKMMRSGRTSQGVRSRLPHIDALVQDAMIEAGIVSADVDVSEFTWRLLSSLRVRELRLEGSDKADRTFAVSRLRALVLDETVTTADALFSRLAELAGRYAPLAAEVNGSVLLSDLSRMPLSIHEASPVSEINQLSPGTARMTVDKSVPQQIMPGHVFLSYAREDTGHVDRLQGSLEDAGVRVWRDTADLWPGENWRAKIRRAITDDALVFIACFSRKSLRRRVSYQNEELVLAIEQLRLRAPGMPWLIPVRFDDCRIPDLDIGGGRALASIQRADLFGSRYAEGMARLVAAVRHILGKHQVAHLICAVETSGSRDRVLKRISRTEQLVQLAESEAGGQVVVSIVSYGEHVFTRGGKYDNPTQILTWANNPNSALSALRGLRDHGIQESSYPPAAAVECMLTVVAGQLNSERLTSEERRPILVSVGSRAAFPLRLGTTTAILPCPLQNDWRAALLGLRKYPGISFGAIHDSAVDDEFWNQLGGGFDVRKLAISVGLLDRAERRADYPL
jgi:TIR domain